ncbi:MAG: zinc dependent phospholipase C family protein [Bacteroidota bacterium]
MRPLFMLILLFHFFSWGFFAHQKINRLAVYTLPAGMMRFYKSNITFIEEHAVDPDKRRYADTAEASRHFLDADRYGNAPFDSIPQKWNDAVNKYGEQLLHENGIIPWQIERTYYSLTAAFRARDSLRILKLSADLGHYISDAHVPLHTTENYNGQLTGQVGIHGFWESRLPELFHMEYDFLVGRAQYINDPLKEAWLIVKKSQSQKDSVLLIEARLSKIFPYQKFTFSPRNGRVERQYSESYSRAYHDRMNGMVEEQMRSSILKTGSYWYSAWLDAGQPILNGLIKIEPDDQEKANQEKERQSFENGKIIGRSEN